MLNTSTHTLISNSVKHHDTFILCCTVICFLLDDPSFITISSFSDRRWECNSGSLHISWKGAYPGVIFTRIENFDGIFVS